MTRVNTAEGGTDGVTVSAANSGGASGDAYGTVVVGAGATCAYSNARAAHGTMSVLTSTGASNVSAYTPYVLASVTEDYSRVYHNVDTLPGAVRALLRYTSAGNQALRVSVVSTGTIRVFDAANNTAGTTTATISVDQWFRIEVHVVFSATVGTCELRLYTTPDSGTPTETLNLTGLALLASSDEFRAGNPANATSAVQVWHDSVAVEGTTWFGPALKTGTLAPAGAFSAAAVGTRTVLGTLAPAGLFAATAAGTRTVLGTTARASTFAATASGTRTVLGATVRASSFAATAVGTRTVLGSTSRASEFVAAASGVRTVLGSTASAFAFTAQATGTPIAVAQEPGTLTVSLPASTLAASAPATATLAASASRSTLTATTSP